MWISRDEYDRLKKCEVMRTKLSEEVKRLASLITEKTKDCRVGPWCKGCIHRGCDRSEIMEPGFFFENVVVDVDGEVTYCLKYLHELCPERETGKSG